MRSAAKLKRSLLYLTLFTLSNLVSCRKDADISKIDALGESYDAAILKDHLVAWYTFNGDDLDHSGNNNNINYNSATPAKGIFGHPNTAYYFDGVSSYMTIPNSLSINPKKITLAAFVKPMDFYQGTCHRNTILYKAYDDNTLGKYLLAYDDNAYYDFQGCYEPVQEKFQNFYGSYGDGQATAAGVRDDSTFIKKGAWYAVVFTYDGKTAKLYINGRLKKADEISTTFTPNEVPVYIGRSPDEVYKYWFTGIIDEIRIYGRAFTEPQVQQLTKTLQTGASN